MCPTEAMQQCSSLDVPLYPFSVFSFVSSGALFCGLCRACNALDDGDHVGDRHHAHHEHYTTSTCHSISEVEGRPNHGTGVFFPGYAEEVDMCMIRQHIPLRTNKTFTRED